MIQDEEAETADGEASVGNPEAAESVTETVVPDVTETAGGDAGDGDKVAGKKTYRQLRAELVERFISSVDTLLATAE